MNVKIYKKLESRVRLTREGEYWVVETREYKGDWVQSPTYSNLKKALRYKHNLQQKLIRDLGWFSYMKERRIKKLNSKRKRLMKKGKLPFSATKLAIQN